MSSPPAADLYRHQPLSQDDDEEEDDYENGSDHYHQENTTHNNNSNGQGRFSPMEIAHNNDHDDDHHDDNVNDEESSPRSSRGSQQTRNHHSRRSEPLTAAAASPISPIMSFIWETEQKRNKAAKRQRRQRHRFSYQGLQREESYEEDDDDDSASFLDGVAVHSSGINYCNWIYALAGVLLIVLLAVALLVPKQKGQKRRGHNHSHKDNPHYEHDHSEEYARTCRQSVYKSFVDLNQQNNNSSKPNAAVAALQHSWKDFATQMEQNDDWCGTTDSCNCTSRVQPSEHNGAEKDSKKWAHNVDQNIELLKDTNDNVQDVVLVGDDLVARWIGQVFGSPQANLADNLAVFENFFGASSSSGVSGLALGVTGDETPHLLQRLHTYLQLDESDNDNGGAAPLPAPVDPHIWWIVIGHNDLNLFFNQEGDNGDNGGELSSVGCSLPGVVAGLMESVSFLLQKRPKAHIVVNSILPSPLTNTNEMWQPLDCVNDALECFAAGHDSGRVHYLDATSLFLVENLDGESEDDDGVPVVNSDLFSVQDPFPNSQGYQVWGQAIVGKVQEL